MTASVVSCAESGTSDVDGPPDDPFVAVEAAKRNDLPASLRAALGGRLIVEAVFALDSAHPEFGGLSGLWLSPDAATMIAINDGAQRWQARLRHDRQDRLIGIDDWSVTELPRRPEETGAARWIDSEALAGDGKGGLVVAYEGEHRLMRWPLDDLDSTPEPLVLPHGLGGPSNSGIEALATLADGRLLALAERVGAWGGEGLMGWVIDEATADDLVYIQGPGFAPTGAARLDEQIYVIERRFSLLGGFQSRLVTFPAAMVQPGARIEGLELASFRWGGLGENFEGIAARRAANGRVLLYLIADDNFSFLQQTLLVQMSMTADGPVN